MTEEKEVLLTKLNAVTIMAGLWQAGRPCLHLPGFIIQGLPKKSHLATSRVKYFWSNGYAYGTVEISQKAGSKQIKLNVLNGKLDFSKISLEGCGTKSLKDLKTLNSGESWQGEI